MYSCKHWRETEKLFTRALLFSLVAFGSGGNEQGRDR
jgi:hypothetical protein